VALDFQDFGRLLARRQVLMEDAESAFLRQGDCQRESVTVSIAADTNGNFSSIRRENREERSVSRGNTAV